MAGQKARDWVCAEQRFWFRLMQRICKSDVNYYFEQNTFYIYV